MWVSFAMTTPPALSLLPTRQFCVCNDGLVGDGITNCSPPPKTVVTKPPPAQSPTCKIDSDCDKLENSVCVKGLCKCKAGFYQSNGKGQCINENECAPGYPNDCDRNALCIDTEGSYTCACKDGYQDLNSQDQPGTTCAQVNECLSPSKHNCDNETQVCIDLPPPMKWQCVERTPAPTPAPTCNDADIKTRWSLYFNGNDVYADAPNFDCNFWQELTQELEMKGELGGRGFCNCKGKYTSVYYSFVAFEISISNRKAGTTLGNVCCYCQGRQEDTCVLPYFY